MIEKQAHIQCVFNIKAEICFHTPGHEPEPVNNEEFYLLHDFPRLIKDLRNASMILNNAYVEKSHMHAGVSFVVLPIKHASCLK